MAELCEQRYPNATDHDGWRRGRFRNYFAIRDVADQGPEDLEHWYQCNQYHRLLGLMFFLPPEMEPPRLSGTQVLACLAVWLVIVDLVFWVLLR